MKKNVAYNVLGSFAYTISQWMITVLIVYLGTYREAGFLSLAMTISSSFAVVTLFNVRGYQISDVKDEFDSNIYVGSRIITCTISFVLCVFYSIWNNEKYVAGCIIAYMVIRIAEGISDVMHGINQKLNRYDLIFKSYIMRGFATVVPFILIYTITRDLLLTLWVTSGANLLISIFFDIRSSWKIDRFGFNVRGKGNLELLVKCLPMVLFSLLLSFVPMLTRQYLEESQGAEILGIYSSIASPTLVVQVFASVVFNPFIPQIATLFKEKKKEQLQKMFKYVCMTLVILMIVSFIGGAVIGKLGLKILYGEYILSYYYLFMPIIGCTVGLSFVWTLSSILIALRKIRALVFGMIICFIICFMVYKPLIDNYVANGVSYVQISVYLIFSVYMMAVCWITIHKEV